jgi:hypothetical protein
MASENKRPDGWAQSVMDVATSVRKLLRDHSIGFQRTEASEIRRPAYRPITAIVSVKMSHQNHPVFHAQTAIPDSAMEISITPNIVSPRPADLASSAGTEKGTVLPLTDGISA